MNNFAENLKNLRKAKNLTQTDLAEKLFTSPQTISRWESGDGDPSLDLLISLADILDVDIHSLCQLFQYTDIQTNITENTLKSAEEMLRI